MIAKMKYLTGLFSLILAVSSQAQGASSMDSNKEIATIGGGCFWCIEAIFQKVEGVEKVESGYAGGRGDNPSYEKVSTGATGHVEVIQLTFDPKIVSFADILEIFFHLHDPTTLNRQGADVGTEYRSAIFYHNEAQRQIAEASKKKIAESGLWEDPIVTEIVPFDAFYRAEDYHQNYYNTHRNQPYCSIVIAPKIQKLYKEFKSKLKPGA